MPLSGDDLICPKFQPNIFDSSRCHDCLRQKHLHDNAPTPAAPAAAAEAPTLQQIPAKELQSITPLTQRAEKDTSAKEDSDGQSVVSSYCDVSGGRGAYEESSLCILSPDCDLYICEGDDSDSTDSRDQSDDPDFSGSFCSEEDYLPIRHRASGSRMTRLDPPPHRPNPRAWMEETRGRDSISRHYVGSKGERERESGYFSLGRAGGIRAFRDKSPPPAHRHIERGHPLPNNHSPDPKALIPFRNPDLGVASERRNNELQNSELPLTSSSPEPAFDLSIEVEAQVGPRALSPTPFKQAESLTGNNRRSVRSSYSSHSSSYQQPAPFDSPRQRSSLSRVPSPSRGPTPFKRTESMASLASLNSRTIGSSGFSKGRDQQSRSPSQTSYGRTFDSGGLQKNFKSIASIVGTKSLSNSYADLRGTLRKAESSGTLSGRGSNSRNSSPSRRGCETLGQSFRKNETHSSLSTHSHDRHSPSPSRRGYETLGRSSLRNTETNSSSYGRSHEHRRSSPTREGYETSSQSYLRKTESNGSLFNSSQENRRRSASPIRKGYGVPSQSTLHNTEASRSLNGFGHESSSSPSSRRGYESPGRSALHKSETSGSTRSHSRDRRHSSPPSRGGETHSFRKTATNCSSSGNGRHSRSPSPSRRSYDAPSQSCLRKAETSSLRDSGRSSRSSSPSKRGQDLPSQSLLRKTVSDSRTDSASSYSRKAADGHTHSATNPSGVSWRGSTHSLQNSSMSQSSSLPRKISENQPFTYTPKATQVAWETRRESSRSSYGRRSPEPRRSSPDARRSCNRNRSPSPHMQRHTSSQSSMDSSESSHVSGGSSGLNREEYAMMADLPKVKTVFQRDGPSRLGKIESQSRHAGREELYKPASHSSTKHSYRERDESVESGDVGRLSRSHSSTSLHLQRPGSPTMEETQPWKAQQRASGHSQRSSQGNRPSVYFSSSVDRADETIIEQPDLLNFKKGWMSKLDENGEWKKHWFVLTDAGLKYYRDSVAEEKDDLDGEIDLKSCVKVSEYDVEKNYGFQIQTRDAVFILSAMTAGIRRNWIEVLRKSVRPSSSPDLTQLPDSSSDKENSQARLPPSTRRLNSQLDTPSTPSSAHRRFDYVELSPVAMTPSATPATQREAGEGQVRDHAHWQEDRGRDVTQSQWEAVLARKGAGGQASDQKQRMEEEIEKKWAEFERLPLKEMRSLPPMGTRQAGLSANEALQREVASLRQQLEELRKGGGGGRERRRDGEREGRGGGGGGGEVCGPRECCSLSLHAMEKAHRQALEELQRQHDRQTAELEREKDRLLQEETQATAQVMEALKKVHREELEREVEKARRLGGTGGVHTHTAQQQSEIEALRRELDGLSERYSQKCLELNRAEQNNGDREREFSRKEREIEQLRKENKDLQDRLTEEIKRLRSFVTGQGSEDIADGNKDQRACELEVLLRVKENEVQYLQREIGCLRNELQFLNTEKRSACERYKEVREELSGMKNRSEREIQSLREHLKLAMAALQEGQRLGNSLDH